MRALNHELRKGTRDGVQVSRAHTRHRRRLRLIARTGDDAGVEEPDEFQRLQLRVNREIADVITVVLGRMRLDALESCRGALLNFADRCWSIHADDAETDDDVRVISRGFFDDLEAGHRREHAGHRVARRVNLHQPRDVIRRLTVMMVRVDDEAARGLRRGAMKYRSRQGNQAGHDQDGKNERSVNFGLHISLTQPVPTAFYLSALLPPSLRRRSRAFRPWRSTEPHGLPRTISS